jgi:hypothetical protein
MYTLPQHPVQKTSITFTAEVQSGVCKGRLQLNKYLPKCASVGAVEKWKHGSVLTENLATCAFRYKGIKQMDGDFYFDNQKGFN